MALTRLDHQYGIKDLGRIPAGHFSPVGMSSDGSVYGTYVSASIGESQAYHFHPSLGFRALSESLSIVEAVGGDGTVVGSLGYGEQAFVYRHDLGLRKLGAQFDLSTATCLNGVGVVGGSVVDGQKEVGALFVNDETILLPEPLRSVSAVSEGGAVAGKSGRLEVFWGRAGETPTLIEIDGTAVWVVGFLDDERLVVTIQRDLVTSEVALIEGGRVLSLPSFGGRSSRGVGVSSSSGRVLMQGTDETGRLVYGVWTEGSGLGTVVGAFEEGTEFLSWNGVGPKGELVGLARQADGPHLVLAVPVMDAAGVAVVDGVILS